MSDMAMPTSDRVRTNGLGRVDILREPSPGTSDGDGGVKILLEFIKASAESSELLEVGEGSFDAVSRSV
ncbi:hypothetical protein GCM10011586_26230 [Silvibacterium dinghuense]|nr:hypothetical protein GCM10011586_26230 [Silvibacterium dinghuense]